MATQTLRHLGPPKNCKMQWKHFQVHFLPGALLTFLDLNNGCGSTQHEPPVPRATLGANFQKSSGKYLQRLNTLNQAQIFKTIELPFKNLNEVQVYKSAQHPAAPIVPWPHFQKTSATHIPSSWESLFSVGVDLALVIFLLFPWRLLALRCNAAVSQEFPFTIIVHNSLRFS